MSLSIRKARRSKAGSDVDMTPMLDIVFILLIFFIVTATFISEEGIELRQSSNDPLCDCGDKPINIYLHSDGRTSVNGQIVEISRIPYRVQSQRAENPQISVTIGADAKAEYGDVVYLKDQFDLVDIPVSLKVRTQS